MPNSRFESPLDDLTRDLVAALDAKVKAVDAYERYIEDAADDDELRDLFEQMRLVDGEHVRTLTEALAHRLDEELGYELEEEDEGYDEDSYDEGDEPPSLQGSSRPSADGGEEAPGRGESTHRRS